jgi:hypothetical protein
VDDRGTEEVSTGSEDVVVNDELGGSDDFVN